MAPFWGFFRTNSPKYCSILLKIWPEVVSNKTNTLFQKSVKILNFGSNGTYPKFTILVHFGVQFTARKAKMLLNTRISTKTSYILRNIKLCKFQVPEKSHYSCKVKQNKIFWGGSKLGLNCPMVPLLKVIINSHIANNTTIHLDAKFQLLGFTQKKQLHFFDSGLNWAYFGVFGGNTPSKERQIELIFWPQVVL